MIIADFLVDAEKRGLAFKMDGERLVVSPRDAITEDDKTFIKANKPAIVVVLATRPMKPNRERECLIVCPGALHELCAGCPSIEEYRGADGLIYSAWCRECRDVGQPMEVRERGTNKWRKIGEDESDLTRQTEGRQAL